MKSIESMTYGNELGFSSLIQTIFNAGMICNSQSFKYAQMAKDQVGTSIAGLNGRFMESASLESLGLV